MGLKPSKWNGTYAAVLLASHFTPIPCFRNPMPKPSCQKSRKAIVTHKVLVTQSSNIVLCDWHSQKPKCVDFQAFSNPFFPVENWCFCFILLSWGVKQTAKTFTFCWFWLWKMHWNGLSGVIFRSLRHAKSSVAGFKSHMISGCWKTTISGKNFTFCWFWLGKMHRNGLRGAY